MINPVTHGSCYAFKGKYKHVISRCQVLAITWTTLAILFFSPEISFAQQTFLPLNDDVIYRYEGAAYSPGNNFHTAFKPYRLKEIPHLAGTDSLYTRATSNKFSNYIFNKDMAAIGGKKISLTVNPVFTTIGGTDIKSNLPEYNTGLGLSVNSDLGNKLSVSLTSFYANDRYPEYLTPRIDSTGILPHNGNYMQSANGAYSYLHTTGYISLEASRYITFQAGVGKNFWGDGYRSLLLSDNANAAPFFKATVNAWKVKYISLFKALMDINSDIGGTKLEEKYSASHALSWHLFKNVNFTLFETVIWRGRDTMGYRGFDVNYLNPVIFYRPVEYSLGSPDNVIMGGGFRIRFFKTNHLYGQLILDEFNLTEVKAGRGWHGNKQGFQAGLKSYKFLFIDRLFFLAEYNYVRPFTYSHHNSLENYGNYLQPEAHPRGANFWETVIILRYNMKRWFVSGKFIHTQFGLDSGLTNYGGNIYRPYLDHSNEFGNYTCQGLKTTLIFGELKLQYLINPKWNLYFEVGARGRELTNSLAHETSVVIFGGLRTAIFNFEYD